MMEHGLQRAEATVSIHLDLKRNTLQSLNVMTSDVSLKTTLTGFQMCCHPL